MWDQGMMKRKRIQLLVQILKAIWKQVLRQISLRVWEMYQRTIRVKESQQTPQLEIQMRNRKRLQTLILAWIRIWQVHFAMLGIISGIIFLFIEKENRFVRYHAWHSIIVYASIIVLFILLSILSAIFAFIPVIGWILSILGTLLGIVLGLGTIVLLIILFYLIF